MNFKVKVKQALTMRSCGTLRRVAACAPQLKRYVQKMEFLFMQCRTSTRHVPFEYHIDEEHRLITITSENGRDFHYRIESLKNLYHYLKVTMESDWVLLGSTNEQNAASHGSVEEWARTDPNFGYYGVTDGLRGRFASYIPAILAQLGFVELEGVQRNNRVRAI